MTIPVDAFTRIRGRAAAVIARFGSAVRFFGEEIPAQEISPGVWSFAVAGPNFTGVGIQTKGDPDEMLGIGQLATTTLHNPVMVLVAAQDPSTGQTLSGTPVPGLRMRWPYDPANASIGIDYMVKSVSAVAPNGSPIYYVVVGDV